MLKEVALALREGRSSGGQREPREDDLGSGSLFLASPNFAKTCRNAAGSGGFGEGRLKDGDGRLARGSATRGGQQ